MSVSTQKQTHRRSKREVEGGKDEEALHTQQHVLPLCSSSHFRFLQRCAHEREEEREREREDERRKTKLSKKREAATGQTDGEREGRRERPTDRTRKRE